MEEEFKASIEYSNEARIMRSTKTHKVKNNYRYQTTPRSAAGNCIEVSK